MNFGAAQTTSLLLTIGAIKLPFIFGLLVFILKNHIDKQWIYRLSVIGAAACTAVNALNLTINAPYDIVSQSYIGNSVIKFDYAFYTDTLTKVVALIVSLVGLIVITVAGIYFKEKSYSLRFFSIIQVFITGMLGLVYSENILLAFIFWELMGITSFLLIAYDTHREPAIAAAKKAFFYTKFGDAFLLLAIILLYSKFEQHSIKSIIQIAQETITSPEVRAILVISGIFIGFAALIKSAQGVFMGWLLDAMEGPAPVSALLHAATMVAAGVILVGRFSPMWIELKVIEPLIFIAGIAACTAILAGLIAVYTDDLKRLLAASTISHLSLMYIGLAVSSLTGSWWLLGAHASFKAGLFLIVGIITVNLGISSLSKLRSSSILENDKWLIASLGIGGLVLSGLPIMSGFFAKESICGATLERIIDAFSEKSIAIGFEWSAIYLLILGSAFITAMYSARLFKLAKPQLLSIELSKYKITQIKNLPLNLIVIGLVISFVYALLKINIWFPSNITLWISFILGLSASITGFWIGSVLMPITHIEPTIIAKRYYFDIVINKIVMEPLYELASLCKSFDEKIIDRFVNMIGNLGVWISKQIAYFDEKLLDGVIRTIAYIYGFFTLLSNFLDRFIIDGLVKQFCETWSRIYKYIKLPQNGQIQAYLLAIMITVVSFALINLPKMIETVQKIMEIQRKATGGS